MLHRSLIIMLAIIGQLASKKGDVYISDSDNIQQNSNLPPPKKSAVHRAHVIPKEIRAVGASLFIGILGRIVWLYHMPIFEIIVPIAGILFSALSIVIVLKQEWRSFSHRTMLIVVLTMHIVVFVFCFVTLVLALIKALMIPC